MVRVSIKSLSGSEEMDKGTMMRVLDFALGRAARDFVSVVDVRIVAITLVFGRRRREAVRASPIPVVSVKLARSNRG